MAEGYDLFGAFAPVEAPAATAPVTTEGVASLIPRPRTSETEPIVDAELVAPVAPIAPVAEEVNALFPRQPQVTPGVAGRVNQVTEDRPNSPAAVERHRRARLKTALVAGGLAVSMATALCAGDITHSLDPKNAVTEIHLTGSDTASKLPVLKVAAKEAATVQEVAPIAPPKDILSKPGDLLLYAAQPDIEIQQIADLIVTAHKIDPLAIDAKPNTRKLVTTMVDDIADSAFSKNISAPDLAKIKLDLAYAYTLANYPQLIQTVSDAEKQTLGGIEHSGDMAKFTQLIQDLQLQLIATGETDHVTINAPENEMLTSLLAFAKEATDAATSSDATTSPTSEIPANPNVFYVPQVADIQKLFPHAKLSVIEVQLPALLDALHQQGLDKDPRVMAYIFATIRVENQAFDSRVTEYGASPRMRYWPFVGEGISQLTWRDNYILYGNIIGQDLVHHRELVHNPVIDSQIVAAFQKAHLRSTLKAINSGDIAAARRQYNGGLNGLGPLMRAYNLALDLFSQRAVDPTRWPLSHIQTTPQITVPDSWQPPKLADECDPVDAAGYSENLKNVADALAAQFGITSLGGVIPPNDKKYGHGAESDHYTGHGADVMLDPRIDPANVQKQEQIANWLAENALRLNIRYLIVGNRIWNIERASEGWRVYDQKYEKVIGSDTDYTLAHYDHIHISVYETQTDTHSTPKLSGAFPFMERGSVHC